MISHQTNIRVRYGEVDRMGYLHHGMYALYFEQARTDLIREIGMSYREIEDRGVIMPVRSMNIRYHQPARYDEEVTVTVNLTEMPGVRLEFEYRVHNSLEVLLCEATTTLVFADRTTGKPMRMPQFFSHLVEPYFK